MKPLRESRISSRSWRNVFVLYKLADLGAHRRTVKISTESLAKRIGSSQQTASRRLIELERMGWIRKAVTPDGCLIKVTDEGLAQLQGLYLGLKALMEASRPLSIMMEGVVFTGLGEGAYYVSQDGYRRQFIEKLGFDPYPGTLNLKLLSDYDIIARSELETHPAIEIEGFKDENRTFGSAKCYPVIIQNEVKGAAILAMRSHYDASVLELIAPVYLRSRLRLKDGNKVKVEVLTLP